MFTKQENVMTLCVWCSVRPACILINQTVHYWLKWNIQLKKTKLPDLICIQCILTFVYTKRDKAEKRKVLLIGNEARTNQGNYTYFYSQQNKWNYCTLNHCRETCSLTSIPIVIDSVSISRLLSIAETTNSECGTRNTNKCIISFKNKGLLWRFEDKNTIFCFLVWE